MIHEVRLPRETKLYLWQIVCAQMDLLRCVASLQQPYIRENVRTSLAKSVPAHRAEQLSQWLFTHSVPRNALEQFVINNDQAARAALVEQFQRDIVRLYCGRFESTLECCFPLATRTNPLPPSLKGVHEFLVYFYKSLEGGLANILFWRDPCSYEKYGREQFFAAFERENPDQHVCAICDEHRPLTILRGEYSSDIEHYFPKSIYPHLACHPYNLIPICGPCNTAHLDKDPLKATGGRRVLSEIFLPYRAEGIARQGVVKLDWQNTKDSPILTIQSREGVDDIFRAKLQAFSQIYDIPGRWQGRIHQIGEQLWRNIRHYVRVEVENGEETDVLQLKAELEQLLGYLFEDLGKSPWAYVLIWYLGNILVGEIEAALQKPDPQGIVPVLDTVRDVLKGKSDAAAGHRLRAKEVIVTARKLYHHE